MIATVKSGKAVYSLIAIVIGLLAMCMAGMTYGQSAVDGFDPHPTSTVDTIAFQPEWKDPSRWQLQPSLRRAPQWYCPT